MVTMVGVALLGASANVWALGEADGQWLKLKFKTQNGLQVNVASGATQKAKSNGTCYTRLDYTSNPTPGLPGFYEGNIICQLPSGLFASTDGDIFLFELPGGFSAVEIDDFASYGNSSGHLVRGHANQQMAIKLSSSGTFKKATFQSNGELTGPDGVGVASLNPADTNLVLIGGYTVTGKSIPASKLPFIPAP